MQSLDSNETFEITVERDQIRQTYQITPTKVGENLLLGVSVYPIVELHSSSFDQSLGLALDETWRVLGLTATMFKKLLFGEVSTKSLGGPLSIAEGAGSSARGGIISFLAFLGMISVNLGLINLLPVPVLDGGHLLFNTLESIKGSPVSEVAQELAMRVGLFLVLSLMAIAMFNDIARL
jgi:regulator of sigma E protease